jgi:omega-amidase
MQWMQEKAKEKNCVITGSFIVTENGFFFNRLVWMKPDGSYHTYDKRHLFRMGEEDKYYGMGKSKLIVDLNGWKICPLICYDLRFPVWSRNSFEEQEVRTKKQEVGDERKEMDAAYDVLIYIANWPEKRAYPWKTLLLARAIENQTYVVGVNRVGVDGNEMDHSGDSVVINFKGEVMSKINANKETTETVVISYNELKAFRKMFPALLDADDFDIL